MTKLIFALALTVISLQVQAQDQAQVHVQSKPACSAAEARKSAIAYLAMKTPLLPSKEWATPSEIYLGTKIYDSQMDEAEAAPAWSINYFRKLTSGQKVVFESGTIKFDKSISDCSDMNSGSDDTLVLIK